MFRSVLAWLYGVGFGAHLVGLPFDVRLVDAILGSKFQASKQGLWGFFFCRQQRIFVGSTLL